MASENELFRDSDNLWVGTKPPPGGGYEGTQIDVLPLAAKSEAVWHYTDVHGFFGMISKKTLWASVATALNDTTEMSYGLGIIESAWGTIGRSADGESQRLVHEILSLGTDAVSEQHFMLSASTDGDSLNQWMHYANGTGFAVQLDPRGALAPPATIDKWAASRLGQGFGAKVSELFPIPGWRPVHYGKEQCLAIAKKALSECFRSDGTVIDVDLLEGVIVQSASLMKNDAFSDEREIRHTFGRLGNDVLHRVSRDRLVSYIEIVGASDSLPIIGVRCGPGTSDRTMQAVRSLLRSNGFTVPVSRSEIPYVS